MYMAPVGLVNAANPAGAYAEALDLAGAHQSSYGREAAAVFAAAVAAACAPDATPDSVVAACLSLAKDGTRAAIEAVVRSGLPLHGLRVGAARRCGRRSTPYDTVGPDYRSPSLGARRPSRLHAIEELPVALGMLLVVGRRLPPCGARLGELRPRLRLDRHDGRGARRRAGLRGAVRLVEDGRRGQPPGPAGTRRRTLTEVAREIFDRDVAPPPRPRGGVRRAQERRRCSD